MLVPNSPMYGGLAPQRWPMNSTIRWRTNCSAVMCWSKMGQSRSVHQVGPRRGNEGQTEFLELLGKRGLVAQASEMNAMQIDQNEAIRTAM